MFNRVIGTFDADTGQPISLYEVKHIDGKGPRIVAAMLIKIGRLILREAPQMPPLEDPSSNPQEEPTIWKAYLQKVVYYFNRMSSSDQEDYLKLNNYYARDFASDEDQEPYLNYSALCPSENWNNLKSTVQMITKDSSDAEKILKIVGIYQSNLFGMNGLRIQSSRISHSCMPNAIDLTKSNEVVATSEILPGQEITFNYRRSVNWLAEKRKIMLPNLPRVIFSLNCHCDLCKKAEAPLVTDDCYSLSFCKEDDDNQTPHKSKLEEWIQAAEKGQQKRLRALKWLVTVCDSDQYYPPKECKKEIACYKQLYKLGKEMELHPQFLYNVVEKGFQAASTGYLSTWKDLNCKCLGLSTSDKHQLMKEFEEDCNKFSKAGKAFHKFLPKEYVDPILWKKRQNFKSYFESEVIPRYSTLY